MQRGRGGASRQALGGNNFLKILNPRCATMVSDPLSAAIDAAIERAIRAQLPSIVEALKQSIEAAAPTPARDEFDRFVKPSEAAAILGMHKTTILMQEAKGRLPKRRRVGEATDYLLSDLNEIMGKAVAS